MQPCISVAIVTALICTCAFSQNASPQTSRDAFVRGVLEVNGLVEKQFSPRGKNYENNICNFIGAIKSYFSVTRGLQHQCETRTMDRQTGSIETMIKFIPTTEDNKRMAFSPSFNEITVNRLLYLSKPIYYDNKYTVESTTTAVYLIGTARKSYNHLRAVIENVVDWRNSDYAYVEWKICYAIKARIAQNPLLRTVSADCGISVFFKHSSEALVHVVMSNDELRRAGLTLDYEMVAWAVHNAVLANEIRHQDVSYSAVMQSVDYAFGETYYLLSGQMKFKGKTLTFRSNEEAKQSMDVRDAIEQLPIIARYHRWMDMSLNEQDFRFKFKSYNPNNNHISVLLIVSAQMSMYAKFQFKPQRFWFPLSHYLVEYQPDIVYTVSAW